ncbi:MAG TPA: methyltransferase domain-containing protein [Microthrixaceae bacterium]|nr:methyltransferase domain-containing protein [Microthrixaceae bacterium]
MSGRNWDAASYDRVGGPMTQMASAVVDRLSLSGSETVMDAGCGTGQVTRMLAELLPNGHVIAVDADTEMVRTAKANLADLIASRRVTLAQGDLTEFTVDEPVDAILSTATFHWISDHQRLFDNLISLLKPGGRLVAQCGGQGNIAELRDLSAELAHDPRFTEWLKDWTPPWTYNGPEETKQRLERAGFDEVRTWLQDWPVTPDDPAGYLSTITLGAQFQRMPAEVGAEFVQTVIEMASSPLTVGYVRLNIDAKRPG